VNAAAQLVATLSRAHFKLSLLPSGGLQVSPASRLTTELRAAIGQHKRAVVALLATPLTDKARQLPEEARELLGVLVWLTEGCGALGTGELAKATGWPLGMVFGVGKTLVLAGLVANGHAGLQPSRRLLSELAQTRH
jgi:hypothetical protein